MNRPLGFNGGIVGRTNVGRYTLSNGIYSLAEMALGYGAADPLLNLTSLLIQPPSGATSYPADSTTAKSLTYSGTVSVVSDPAFPTGSAIEFGGGKITLASDPVHASGSGDWTVEALVKLSSLPSSYQCIYATRPSSAGYSDSIYFGVGPGGIALYSNSFNAGPAGTLTTGSVLYLAARRIGGSLLLQIDDAVVAAGTTSQSWVRTIPSVGALATGGEAFSGRIGALRVTNFARVLVKPTTPWPAGV